MLKIFINGESGKMGASIIKLIDDDDSFIRVEKGDLITADVVIDFSHPNSTLEILQDCLENKKPLVIGTTGLKNNHIKEIEKASKMIPILIASNMSKGIINLKKSLKDYISNNSESMNCMIEEVHHIEKIDSPSGTAIELKDHILSIDNKKNINSIEITSKRIKNVFGVHKVSFIKKDEVREFMHEALSRNVFSFGALYAAKQISKLDPRIYRFQDI